ncbi:MAG: ferritin-like domain-containing protein [Thermoleophilia bacterium]|nr:ferritin-like domain-containing protein [Thermoleophilia bacterium]
MPKTMSPRDLFVEELSDVLTAERTVAKMLPQMQRQASDKKLVGRIKEHVKETQQQIKNVEQVFQQLGTRPKRKPCPGIEGIRSEFEEVSQEDGGTPELRDLHLLGPAARTEHYEIAAYEGLVTMAKAMGESKAANLLEKNLKQEQAMLRDGKTVARRLAGKVVKAEGDAPKTQARTRGSTRSRSGRGRSRTRSSRR